MNLETCYICGAESESKNMEPVFFAEEHEIKYRCYIHNLKENISHFNPQFSRKLMIELGWDSHDNYSHIGWKKWAYSIGFERWDWHGVKSGFKIYFHCSTDNPDLIEKCIITAAQLALNAWDDFPNSIPVQLADNSIVEDKLATELFREQRLSTKK